MKSLIERLGRRESLLQRGTPAHHGPPTIVRCRLYARPHCGHRYATPSTGVVPKTVTVTNAVLAPKPTAWLRNSMSLFGVPPGTMMLPIAVQADTSLGFVVTCTFSEPGTGPRVLRQASRVSASATPTLTERGRVEASRLGLDVGIALLPRHPKLSNTSLDRWSA